MCIGAYPEVVVIGAVIFGDYLGWRHTIHSWEKMLKDKKYHTIWDD